MACSNLITREGLLRAIRLKQLRWADPNDKRKPLASCTMKEALANV